MANKNPEGGRPEETEGERAQLFQRNCRHFIDYITYDWEADQKWVEFKATNMKGVTDVKQVEEIKREYFKLNINQRLQTTFVLESESQQKEFLDICKYEG